MSSEAVNQQEIRNPEKPLKYRGRISQIFIYLGKFFRMFIYQSDWKVLPFGAVIAAIVTFVVGANMFKTQEGTINGAFALTCCCIWNGFFNSIQVVCRERNIVKREHRAGLHSSSYIIAHMLYQLVLCLAQTVITLLICWVAKVQLPVKGIVTPWGIVDLGITILLTTYAADMLALMVSCIVHTTTTAMTVMPFLLIFQLVFSGAFFQLQGFAQKITALTISRWGMESMCAVGRFNELPMVTLWNTIFKFKDIEFFGTKPILAAIQAIEGEGKVNDFLLWSGQSSQRIEYASEFSNVLQNWGWLLLITAVSVLIAVIALKLIDRDKR